MLDHQKVLHNRSVSIFVPCPCMLHRHLGKYSQQAQICSLQWTCLDWVVAADDQIPELCCRFSVAWYPAYRIPDAPLNGRFLTFHHLTPQARPASGQPETPLEMFSASRDPPVQAESSDHSAGAQTVDIPMAGLKLCNLHGERWLEPLSMDALVDNRASQHGSQLHSNNRGRSVSSAPLALQHHLNALQHHAEYLARGQGLRLQVPEGLERLQQRHPDFEFFHTRH